MNHETLGREENSTTHAWCGRKGAPCLTVSQLWLPGGRMLQLAWCSELLQGYCTRAVLLSWLVITEDKEIRRYWDELLNLKSFALKSQPRFNLIKKDRMWCLNFIVNLEGRSRSFGLNEESGLVDVICYHWEPLTRARLQMLWHEPSDTLMVILNCYFLVPSKP